MLLFQVVGLGYLSSRSNLKKRNDGWKYYSLKSNGGKKWRDLNQQPPVRDADTIPTDLSSPVWAVSIFVNIFVRRFRINITVYCYVATQGSSRQPRTLNLLRFLKIHLLFVYFRYQILTTRDRENLNWFEVQNRRNNWREFDFFFFIHMTLSPQPIMDTKSKSFCRFDEV